MKLARNLTIALVLGFFAVFAINAYVRIQREAGLFEADIRRDDRAMGRALAAAVVEIWRTEGEARALRLVEEANERESQIDIRWVWLDAPPGDPHASRLPPAHLARVRGGQEVVRKIRREEGEHVVTCVPVAVPGARAGALELSESLAGEEAYIRTTIVNTLIATAAMTLLSALITTSLGLWLVGRPMRALSDQARRIGAGDLTRRLDLRQSDEIGELAAEMNRMCDRLAEAQGEIARETSARIAALEQLRHAERLATVGKLASGIAHELGTPLQIVTGHAGMIADGDADGEEAAASACVILDEAQRITRIIRQLLDFARRRTAEKREADLAEVVQGTLTLLAPLADKRGITLAHEGDPSTSVEIDVEQIQQALTNVVVNGIQAMPAGGRLTVRVRRARATPPPDHGGPEGEYAAISVEDEGEGIPEEAVAHVFEPFFTTKPVGEGTGLGLSVAYGIVREHNGWIDVDSRPGSGAQFTFYLPAGRGAA